MIVGIDISTHQLDFGFIDQYGRPFRTTSRHIPGDPSREAERARAAGRITTQALTGHPNLYAVVIERPIGRFAVPQLSAIFGAVCAGIPPRIHVTQMKPNEWRSILGITAKGTPALKSATITYVSERWSGAPLSEHEADALGIALATHHVYSEASA